MNKIGNLVLQKEYNNVENNNDQMVYAYMARMSDNDECPIRNFGDSLQLINCILYSGAMCRMTPEVSYFIPGSLDNTDIHIEVADGHHVMAKKRQVQIKMCDDNGDTLSQHCTTYF